MNKYAQTALKAHTYIEKGISAEEAWEKASCEYFKKGAASQVKGCPKCAFLGFFSKNEKITESKNAQYAKKALKVLQTDPKRRYTAKELWVAIGNENKSYNQQMDVVLILWEKGIIK